MLGVPLDPDERAAFEGGLAAAHSALGEDAYATAWEAGRAMQLEEVVAYALAGASDAN